MKKSLLPLVQEEVLLVHCEKRLQKVCQKILSTSSNTTYSTRQDSSHDFVTARVYIYIIMELLEVIFSPFCYSTW